MKNHAAIVIEDNGKILFIKRSISKKSLPGIISFPSGTIEENENAFDCSKREAFEELGVEVFPEKIIAELELRELDVKLIFVLCSIESGEPFIKEPLEIDEIIWMNFDEFFEKYSDEEIGHGLVWLRKNKDLLNEL